ncbi:6184_t:CDS:2 [Paraglomus brasilianum]|uniref:6184_t:CDS:1 n=1 Tax=Paraglomus brasilianum TaxID=144538 RepID=A0A9N9FUW7_9GLOM|nr:6184_t:CDS:2 [Paraglomus brasilianum]
MNHHRKKHRNYRNRPQQRRSNHDSTPERIDLQFDQRAHSSITSNQRTQQTGVNYAGLNREDTSTNSLVPRQIPGYYYDQERKRYFRILPSSVTSSSHPYSADSIRTKLKNERKASRQQACTSAKPIRFQNAAVNLANREIFPSPA